MNHWIRGLAMGAMAILGSVIGAGCQGGLLVSDESASPSAQAAPVGVDERNLDAKPKSSPVKTGDPIPGLILTDQKGREVSTRELVAGRDALLIFSPGVDSPAARPIYEWVRQNRNLIEQRQCEILIVSPDDNAQNDRLATEEVLRLAILSDPSAWCAKAFGVAPAKSRGVGQPWTVIIGREGRIMQAKPGLYDITDAVFVLSSRPRGDDLKVIDMFK